MAKIYFFQKRNPNTGELLDKVVDCDEKTAWTYYNAPRFYKYLGWSDGRFMKEIQNLKFRQTYDKKGLPKQATKILRKQILEAAEKEKEFAKNNPDKTPPRDFTKVGLDGQPIRDRDIYSALNRM
jgi:hypothetical protein